MCITYFTFDDSFTAKGNADRLIKIVEKLLIRQNIDIELFRGTEISMNYWNKDHIVDNSRGKAHYFLNLGTVKNEVGFYDDVVEPGITKLISAWRPKETFDLTADDIGAKSLGEASIEKLSKFAEQFVRRIVLLET